MTPDLKRELFNCFSRLCFLVSRGGELIYYHGSYKWWVIAGGPKKTIELLQNLNLYLNMMDSLDIQSKYLVVMELRFDTILYSTLGNENYDVGHIKCPRVSQVPHP